MPMDPQHRKNISEAMRRRFNEITKDEVMKYIYETYFRPGGAGGGAFTNDYNEWKVRNV